MTERKPCLTPRQRAAIGTNVNQIARRLNDVQLPLKDRKLTKAEGAQISVLKGDKVRDRDAAFRTIVSGAQDGAQ